MIQTLAFHGSDPSFSIGVKVRRTVRNPFNLGIMRFEQFVKLFRELGITVPDEEFPGFILKEGRDAFLWY